MKQDKGDKIIQKAERRAQKAAQQVQVASKKAEAAKKKQAEQAQKKAARAADNATKKAAKKTKKADAAAKKAQLAAKKAEEKKAKAVAKAAAKATAAGGKSAGGEGGEEGAPAASKKKSKKKLLMIAVPALAVAIGVGAFFFLRGGDEEEPEGPPEPIAIPSEYVMGERKVSALPVWGDEVLVYQEEIPPEEPEASGEAGEEGEESGETADAAAEEGAFVKTLYRYEGLQSPGKLIAAYTAMMLTEDAGFSTVDEELLRIDPPEFTEDQASGSVLLARNVPALEEGGESGVQSMLLTWEGANCAVTLDMPEGRVHDPKPETPAAVVRRGIEDLEALHPSKLGLPGESMEEYELLIQDGSVRIAKTPCMRVNVYDSGSQIAGSFFLSSDGKLYKLDEANNGVVELDWE